MKLKNISARAYGVNGKIVAPLEVFEVLDELTMASIKMHIGGDFVEVESEEKKKPGRPAKESEAE